MSNFLIKNKIVLVLIIIGFFFGPHFSKANDSARVSFEASGSTIAPGSQFQVDVLLNSDVSINAFDLQISYPLDRLKFLGGMEKNSIVDLWQYKDIVRSGHIQLTGAILKPFSGQRGQIIRLSFEILDKTGEAKIFFERNNLYLADGKGTKILAETSPLSVFVDKNISKTLLGEDFTKDITPPELFIGLSKDLAGNRFLVIFNAKDKESGVKTTEMRTKKWLTWSSWQEVKNPALVPDGVWKIQIRAENNNKLTTTESIFETNKLFNKLLILIFSLLFVVFLIVMYNKYKHKL